MTLTNREVLVVDPTERDIPNLGVVKVRNPKDQGDWDTLEWELRTFVCEGAYERGLDTILREFLGHLSQSEQPAAWVSGFYGSGKSHLVRVLEYLWRDITLPSGVSARSLTTLPPDISAHLAELSTAARREGGLWSAAGTLGSGAAGSVRLAFLGVIFAGAGLPDQYAPGRLALWMHHEGFYDKVKASVEASGKDLAYALRNLYVDKTLAQALIDAGSDLGDSPKAVLAALQAQFRSADDIDNEEMLDVFEDVLRLQTKAEGRLPLTLIVLDEMQQYINEDNKTAELVQLIVEGCSARFKSQVLIVATGQAALTATPVLQKLTDRFKVAVALSDTDVENVVRKVVLLKKPDKVAEIEAALDAASGEVSQELGGTRIEPVGADKSALVPDYPLLPTRRRFWEHALKAVDKAGKSGVLRTQLKIVHEAAKSVADRPVGTVIGGDFVFESESASMLQTGVLLKEIDELIRGLDDGSDDGRLKSRAASLVFLISQLPRDGVNDQGVRATAGTIADLLVQDLAHDGAHLRREIPRLMDELVDGGRVLKIGDEYHLQTAEGAEWTQTFNQRRNAIKSDVARMAALRNDALRAAVENELGGLSLRHGASRVPRKIKHHWEGDPPATSGDFIPVWFRDEWNVSESKVRDAAAAAGNNSPIVFVYLPKAAGDAIGDALAEYAAARDTVSQRPEPQTAEGKQAKQGMQSRERETKDRVDGLFRAVIERARVLQGGGNELTVSNLRDAVQKAASDALVRKFPKFAVADHPDWNKVISKARDGDPAALAQVGHNDEPLKNAVCKEVLSRVTAAGTKGSDLQKDLGGGEYGWHEDAVNGALLVLLSNGNIRAELENKPIAGPKELPQTQVGKATFYKEDEPPTVVERLAVKGLLQAAGVDSTPSQEGVAVPALLQRLKDLAAGAGGPAPLPDAPDTTHVDALAALAGNQQVRAVAQAQPQLKADIDAWSALSKARPARDAAWQQLDRLLRHSDGLPVAIAVAPQKDAIAAGRQLLASPDPVGPLVKQLADDLRCAVTAAVDGLNADVSAALAELRGAPEWVQVDPDDRDQIVKDNGLAEAAASSVASDEDLLHTLDATPLATWAERRQLVQPRLGQARAALAKKLEPASVTVTPPRATIRTQADADTYLAALKQTLDDHVAEGHTVII